MHLFPDNTKDSFTEDDNALFKAVNHCLLKLPDARNIKKLMIMDS